MDSVLTFAEFFILYLFYCKRFLSFEFLYYKNYVKYTKTALRIHVEPIHFEYCHFGVRSMIAICS